ncbi:MAG: flagellar basal-body rod protein FlgG [Magnetococcales bacterium]|nr:flagellar basal-body rod protein FlgG [Magnetococcales bacterium]
MIRAMWTAATGMQAQQTGIDTIANNLANVNTTGFKQSRTDFQDLLYANLRPAGSETSQSGTMVPVGIQLGHGVKVVGVSKEFSQGSMVQTNEAPNNVDMAINGQGFFQIRLPDGRTAYTRDGSFKTTPTSAGATTANITTADGNPVIGGDSLSYSPSKGEERIVVAPDGSIQVFLNNTTSAPRNGGQIELANFVNPAGLTAIGNNLFVESPASGAPFVSKPNENGMGSLVQHHLEQSNVNMVTEMVNMITAQRAYEIGTKSIQTADTVLGLVTQLKR